jgi:hypothetical protein
MSLHIKQYEIVPGVVTHSGEILLLTDDRLVYCPYEDTDSIGDLLFEDEEVKVIDCCFNLITKQIKPLTIVDYKDEPVFKVGESVFVTTKDDCQTLYESKIKDIVYTENRKSYYKGVEMLEFMSDVEIPIDLKAFYCVRKFKPLYVLTNDLIVSRHKLYNKQ